MRRAKETMVIVVMSILTPGATATVMGSQGSVQEYETDPPCATVQILNSGNEPDVDPKVKHWGIGLEVTAGGKSVTVMVYPANCLEAPHEAPPEYPFETPPELGQGANPLLP